VSPAAKRRAVDMLNETLKLSERLACRAVGLARSTYRVPPLAKTPEDPDAALRAWLRCYAAKHPRHGLRRAWATLRYDEGREVNNKKIHRLWREEGLQVRVRSLRKRAGVSSILPVEADAPNVLWAIAFQFDSTTDGKAITIASMIDEHTRESLLDLAERSITGEDLVEELRKVFAAAGGPPKALRMDNRLELFPKRCNNSASAGTEGSISRQARRGTADTSKRSTTDSEGSASTATLGTPFSRFAWSSGTSNMTTITATGIRLWATEHRPSTLRRADTSTPQWPARSTESGSKQPDSNFGWTQYRGLATLNPGPNGSLLDRRVQPLECAPCFGDSVFGD